MSSPRAVVVDQWGSGVIFHSRHDQNCEVNECGRTTHVGLDNSGGEYSPLWLCMRCLLAGVVEALE